MNRAVQRHTDRQAVGDRQAMSAGADPGSTSDTCPADFPVHRKVIIHLTGGLDGVVRLAVMLRGRGYQVRDLIVEVREGVVVSEVRATIVTSSSGIELLLERLRRLAVVVDAVGG